MVYGDNDEIDELSNEWRSSVEGTGGIDVGGFGQGVVLFVDIRESGAGQGGWGVISLAAFTICLFYYLQACWEVAQSACFEEIWGCYFVFEVGDVLLKLVERIFWVGGYHHLLDLFGKNGADVSADLQVARWFAAGYDDSRVISPQGQGSFDVVKFINPFHFGGWSFDVLNSGKEEFQVDQSLQTMRQISQKLLFVDSSSSVDLIFLQLFADLQVEIVAVGENLIFHNFGSL